LKVDVKEDWLFIVFKIEYSNMQDMIVPVHSNFMLVLFSFTFAVGLAIGIIIGKINAKYNPFYPKKNVKEKPQK